MTTDIYIYIYLFIYTDPGLEPHGEYSNALYGPWALGSKCFKGPQDLPSTVLV